MTNKEYLIKSRKERKIRAKDIAKSTGIESSKISRFENGKHDLRYSEFVNYAEYLGFELKLQVK